MNDNPFERVLDRLREKGWLKYSIGTKEGPNCINGAIWYEVQKNDEYFRSLRNWLEPLVRAEYPDRVWFFINPSFNNHPDTTFDDVERVLEKAAVKWEEERVLRDE